MAKNLYYEYAKPEKPDEGPIYRSIEAKDGLTSGLTGFGIETIYDVLQVSAKKYADKNCMGYRNTIRTHVETKYVEKLVDGKIQKVAKDWTYFEMGPYKYISYRQVNNLSHNVGKGLRELGIKPSDRVQIYASTSHYWMLSALGAFTQSMTIVTAYDTLGPEGLIHSVEEAEAKVMFTDALLLKTLEDVLEYGPNLRTIIYKGEVSSADLIKFKSKYADLKILSFEKLLDIGENSEWDPTKPSFSDCCCIMYTSGSVGKPKGVVLTHENVIAALSGFNLRVNDIVTYNDQMICYLPLAHILELAFEILCLFLGGTIGYASVKTLTEMNMRNCNGDIIEFKPTIMVGVPAVWELVRKGITRKVSESNLVVRKLFWGGFALKDKLLNYGIPGSSIIDNVIFRKVKAATGGRLRFVLNGGAALAPSTRHFISLCIAPMVNGYGLTETCAALAVMAPKYINFEDTGPPLSCVEIKLRDVPDAGYKAYGGPRQQGEVLVRGKNVTPGYFKLEKENSEAFEDGWFLTGDIGEWTKEGQLRLIDRRKNLVKTANGEYIALEKLESIYRTCVLVNNVCIFADPAHVKPLAIVVPHEPNLRKAATSQGYFKKDHSNWESICDDSRVRNLVHKTLLESGRTRGLSGIELVQSVILSAEDFTPENGLLTSAQKLQRRKIQDVFQNKIELAYRV